MQNVNCYKAAKSEDKKKDAYIILSQQDACGRGGKDVLYTMVAFDKREKVKRCDSTVPRRSNCQWPFVPGPFESRTC